MPGDCKLTTIQPLIQAHFCSMRLIQSRQQVDGYVSIWHSEGNIWHIGIYPVIFGVRAIAWRSNSTGRCVDYCAGANAPFLLELLTVLRDIFDALPEDISESELLRLLPDWKHRPIDQDPCWPALQALALKLQNSPIAHDS